MRPVVFVIDKTCGGVLDDAMQAMDWVLAEARERGMGREVAVDVIGYDIDAASFTPNGQFLNQYFWTGCERSIIGGYIAEALPLVGRFLDAGRDYFENAIVVFLCRSEPRSFWRGKVCSLEAECPLFRNAQRIAIHLGDGDDTSYLWTLAGLDGNVARSIPELRQVFSEALLGKAESGIEKRLRELQELLDGLNPSDDGWNSGWGSAENAREDFSEPPACAENAREDFDGGLDLEIVNDLDDDPADEGFGDGWGGVENARESYYEPSEPQGVSVSEVQFSAVAPREITKGEYAMIDIAVYEEAYRHVVDRIIAEADSPVKETFGGVGTVRYGTEITVRLSSPDVEIWDDEESAVWNGKYLHFNFVIDVPASYAKRQILLIATVYFNGVIATRLKMLAHCSTMREQKLSITREDVLRAFVSYASPDRSRVATIIQGMKKARPDMDVFFDVESLRSGEDWGLALRREIEDRDVLFLCWSHNARASKWVEAEWRYALEQKGLDAIEPVPLESPDVCPPPPELNSKHFNDRALLYH